MEVPEIHNIEFDLYKIKGVDVFDMFKKKVEAKLRELNIKYDIKLVDEHEDEHLMKGGSKSTYPYNVFEDALDSIVGKKQENQKERKSLFDMLFSSPKDKPPASKSSGFFDMFQSSKKAPEEKKAQDETLPIESKNKDSKPIIDEKTMKSITDSEAFSIKKAEVKEAYNTEVPTPSPEDTIEEPTVFSEEKKEPSIAKEEEPTVFSEEKGEPSVVKEAEEKEEEEESSIFDEEEEEEVKETMPEVKEEKELVEDFLKTQTVFIKVIVSIYHDKKNEKSLPAKIGIKKWLFN